MERIENSEIAWLAEDMKQALCAELGVSPDETVLKVGMMHRATAHLFSKRIAILVNGKPQDSVSMEHAVFATVRYLQSKVA